MGASAFAGRGSIVKKALRHNDVRAKSKWFASFPTRSVSVYINGFEGKCNGNFLMGGRRGGSGCQIRLDKRAGVDLYGKTFRAMINPIFWSMRFPSGNDFHQVIEDD